MAARTHRRPALAFAGLVALGVAGTVVVRGLQRPAYGIERLLDHPDRLRFAGAVAAAPAETPPLRWDAEAIARGWEVVDAGRPTLLRSPPLDLGGGLDGILVTLAASAHGRARLLWSAAAFPSAGDRARNTQELVPRADGPLLETVRGERALDAPLAERAEPPRHLFLEGASPGAILSLVRAVEVARVTDRLRGGAGAMRASAGGEIRDALHVLVPDEISYSTVLPPEAELRVGLSARDTPGPVRVSVVVQSGRGRRTRTVMERVLEPAPGWADVRVPLRARGPATLTLRAAAERPGGAVLWGSPALAPASAGSGPPNVIVYLVDALRPDHLGFGGYGKPTSPFLDALARRSLVFRRAYAGASWTKPSVATLLTSLQPQTHGVGARSYGDALADEFPTLADVLARHGYATALFSANPLGGTASGLDRRFDQAFTPAALSGHAGGGKVRAAELNAPLLRWLEAHARDRFLAVVHTVDPHPPYASAGDETAAYDEEVAAADAALRALYERLEGSGLARRTLLVVTSDHGRALGEKGRTGHGLSVHEDQVRVPLLLHHPGGLEAGVAEAPVHLVDVLPTVLAHCGVPAPPGVQGRSLLGRRPAGPVFVSRFVFPEDRGHGPEQVAMVEHPFKLIVTEAGAARPARAELFDLGPDPREENDLASRDPERVRAMSRALEAFLRGQAEAHAARARKGGGAAAIPPPEMLEQLRALGYAR
jgi:arylsulfatase A-like enzyme